MTTHELKSWPHFFGQIIQGTRRHELRRNDRDFHVGDGVILHEFDPETQTYTGRTCRAFITSITSSDEPCAVSAAGLHRDFCILSIEVVEMSHREPEPVASQLRD